MKICIKCQVEKELTEFYDNRNTCKLCKSNYYKNKHKNDPEFAARRKTNALKYYYNNKEKCKENVKNWKKSNPEKRRELDRKSRHRPENKLKRNLRIKNIYKNNPHLRIRISLSKRIRQTLKASRTNKTNKTMEYTGCSIEFLKNYIELKFKPGMKWQNYGEWEIDHIIPCAAFDLTKLEQQKICFHYSNLQPLWAIENIKKQDKLPNGELGRNSKIINSYSEIVS